MVSDIIEAGDGAEILDEMIRFAQVHHEDALDEDGE